MNKEITCQLDPNRQDANAITFDEKKISSAYKASWVEQFKALIWRGFLSSIKEPMLVKMRIVEFIVSLFHQTQYKAVKKPNPNILAILTDYSTYPWESIFWPRK